VNERAIHCSFNETEGLGEVPYRAIGDTGSPLGGDPVLEEAKLSMISGCRRVCGHRTFDCLTEVQQHSFFGEQLEPFFNI